jgi:REP-associated tyrosine transposase
MSADYAMSRLRRIAESHRFFFITTHFRSDALPLEEEEQDIVLQSIRESREQRHFLLIAYSIMPTHLHILLAPHDQDTIRNIMRDIKLRSSKRVSAKRGHPCKLWQARSFDRIMRHRQELSETIEYIHLNPVRDGLVKDPFAWKRSSARAYLRTETAAVPVDFIDLPIDGRTPLRW